VFVVDRKILGGTAREAIGRELARGGRAIRFEGRAGVPPSLMSVILGQPSSTFSSHSMTSPWRLLCISTILTMRTLPSFVLNLSGRNAGSDSQPLETLGWSCVLVITRYAWSWCSLRNPASAGLAARK